MDQDIVWNILFADVRAIGCYAHSREQVADRGAVLNGEMPLEACFCESLAHEAQTGTGLYDRHWSGELWKDPVDGAGTAGLEVCWVACGSLPVREENLTSLDRGGG